MEALKQGERVVHPVFGLGTVLADEAKGRVEVRFDKNGQKMLALKYALLQPVSPDQETAIRAEAQASLEQSFEFETGDSHSPGSHWPPFYDSFLDEVVRKLDTIMPQCTPALGVSSSTPIARWHCPTIGRKASSCGGLQPGAPSISS